MFNLSILQSILLAFGQILHITKGEKGGSLPQTRTPLFFSFITFVEFEQKKTKASAAIADTS